MICKKCGKEFDNDSLFCSYCGQKVEEENELKKNKKKHFEFNHNENILIQALYELAEVQLSGKKIEFTNKSVI